MDSFIEAAVAEAERGLGEGGVPIGAVLVRGGRIIGRGRNRRMQDGDPVAHAEIDCLRNAGRVGSYRDTVLYSTLMPCHMCAGAVIQFAIPKVIAGESHTFRGARGLLGEHGVEVVDLNLDACRELMRRFIDAHPDLWNEDIGGT